jgi:transposase
MRSGGLVAGQAAQLAEQAVLIEALRVELEALRRQVGRDSSNSSQPPSTDGLGAKARARADKPPAGAGVAAVTGRAVIRGPVAIPDRREPVEPSCCGRCGGDVAGAPGTVGARVQMFDLPVFSLLLPDPPGRRVDHGRVRQALKTALGEQEMLGAGRDPRPADRCRRHRYRSQRAGLR